MTKQCLAEQNAQYLALEAGEDLSAGVGLIVAAESDGSVKKTTAYNVASVGVVVYNAQSDDVGSVVKVQVGGIARVKCGEAIAKNELVISGADGKAYKATAILQRNAIGICREASTAANAYASVELFDRKADGYGQQYTKFTAGADLRTKVGYAVKVDTAGKVNVCAAGQGGIGILVTGANSNGEVIVLTHGYGYWVAGGTLSTIGTKLASDANGKAAAATVISANTGTGAITGSVVLATQLATGTGDAEMLVFVNPGETTHTYA